MLKIIDLVDLKELEKFGFYEEFDYETDYSDNYEFENKYIYELGNSRRGQFYFYLVDKDSRIISVYATQPDGDGTDLVIDSTIFDLIQAGLVEKVQECSIEN